MLGLGKVDDEKIGFLMWDKVVEALIGSCHVDIYPLYSHFNFHVKLILIFLDYRRQTHLGCAYNLAIATSAPLWGHEFSHVGYVHV